MSETKRIKRVMNMEAGTIEYSLGEDKQVFNVKELGLKVNGITKALITALVELKLTTFCAGGNMEVTRARMAEFVASVKAGQAHVLLPWSELKYVRGLRAFWAPIKKSQGEPVPSEAECYAWIEAAKQRPDKADANRTAFDGLLAIPAFRKAIPKQTETEETAPSEDVLSGLGL